MALDYQFLKHKSYTIGIGIMHYKSESGTKDGWLINVEYMPKDDPKINDIYGLTLSGYLAYKKYLNFGYGLGYFKDISKYNIVINPEFGLGYKSLFLVYRRNFSLFRNELNLNKNNLSIRLYVPFDKKWVKQKT